MTHGTWLDGTPCQSAEEASFAQQLGLWVGRDMRHDPVDCAAETRRAMRAATVRDAT